jgi:RNA polymerase sigma-70 factor (ECF subfamily)
MANDRAPRVFFGGISLTTAGVHRLSLVARTTRVVQGQPRHDEQVDELLAGHADAVYRYALRLTRDADRAQDLMQETLLRGWQSRGKLRAAGAARVWLLRIATNLHRDQCRAAEPTEPILAEPTDRQPPHAGGVDHRECVERALAALDELPPRQRQVMHLVTIEQLSHGEAAEVLGITAAALKSNLSQARRQMRQRLKDVYDELRGVRTQDS